MIDLFQPLQLKKKTIANRICVPAMVCATYSDENGLVSEQNIAHYQSFAKGGAGFIIQEATSISTTGKVAADQLGIWCDGQIDGLKKITEAVHKEGGTIVVQLCHAGVVSIEEENFCPSAYTCTKNGRTRTGIEMTSEDITRIQGEFVKAAVRAYQAGYDGIELHGCHRYLISQFYNTRVNKRADAYGAKPSLFVLEIIKQIKELVTKDFIIGIRLGGFEPTLEDSIANAVELFENGIDFLDISYGCTGEQDNYVPEEYPFKDIIYAAAEIKKHVTIPVFAVNGIRTPKQAEDILAIAGVDMVAIGSGMLVNPAWAKNAKEKKEVGKCLECRQCLWHSDPKKCPGGRLLAQKQF